MKNTINILEILQNIMGAKLSYLIEPSKSYWSYTGKFSITNLSRWILRMSKRRLERFYARPHDWVGHCGILVQSFLNRYMGSVKDFTHHWVLAVDETVEKKSGHATHGVGYNYSSKAEKVIRSIAVFNLSLTHRWTKISLPLIQEQLIYPTVMTEKRAKKKAAKKAQKLAQRTGSAPKAVQVVQKTGRPKGSKNKPKNSEGGEKEEIAYTFQVLNAILGRFVSLYNAPQKLDSNVK